MDSTRVWRSLRTLVCVATAIYLIAPMLVVVIMSFSSAAFLSFPPPGFSLQWYESLVTSPYWLSALGTTICVTVPASLLSTALGSAAALVLARSTFPGKTVLKGILVAPIVVPSVIAGAGLFLAFGMAKLNGSLLGLIIAHIVLTVPYVVTTVSAALSTFDFRLEDAAATLGAGMWETFRWVTLPLILPGVLSGFMFSVTVSFDEFVVSNYISSPTVRPVTVQMWSNVLGDVDPTISAIGTILFAASLLGLAVSVYFGRSGPQFAGAPSPATAQGGD